MRRILPADLEILARYLVNIPTGEKFQEGLSILCQVEIADVHRLEYKTPHKLYGTGSICSRLNKSNAILADADYNDLTFLLNINTAIKTIISHFNQKETGKENETLQREQKNHGKYRGTATSGPLIHTFIIKNEKTFPIYKYPDSPHNPKGLGNEIIGEYKWSGVNIMQKNGTWEYKPRKEIYVQKITSVEPRGWTE